MKYKEWFDELIAPFEKSLPPQQTETNNDAESIYKEWKDWEDNHYKELTDLKGKLSWLDENVNALNVLDHKVIFLKTEQDRVTKFINRKIQLRNTNPDFTFTPKVIEMLNVAEKYNIEVESRLKAIQPQQTESQAPEKKIRDLTTGYLAELNIDNYVNWLLTHKSYTRVQKKANVMSLMRGREKTIANYRIYINEVFVKTTYWREPSKNEIEYFGIDRKTSFESQKHFYDFKLEGSPLPLDEIKKEVGENIANTINNLYKDLVDIILKGVLTEEYYRLAHLVGIIDFLKVLHGVSETIQPQQKENKKPIPKTFEDLFYNPSDAETCLNILRQLEKPVIDAKNNYIGKNKGIFPLWVKILLSHKPEPIIKYFQDEVYKDLLNKKIIGLNLSKDASEFRKEYAMLKKNKIELEINILLSQSSQSSQSGKLGK